MFNDKIIVKPGIQFRPSHYVVRVTVPALSVIASSVGSYTEKTNWIDMGITIPDDVLFNSVFSEIPGRSANASVDDANNIQVSTRVYWEFKTTNGSIFDTIGNVDAFANMYVKPDIKETGYRDEDIWFGLFDSFADNFYRITSGPFNLVYQVRLCANLILSGATGFPGMPSGQMTTTAGNYMIGFFERHAGDDWLIPDLG